MKTNLYTNCSLVRVPIVAGVTDYTLPQNVEWADRKIDRLVIVAPDSATLDPVDGQTPVLDYNTLQDMYVTLYDQNNNELMHDVSYEQLSHRNNNALPVNSKLNLSLCRISFTKAPVADRTLLIYVFYGTYTEDYYDMPRRQVTVSFPLAANEEISFRDMIDYTIHGLPTTVKGIIVWDPVDSPVWLTLRDHDLTYQMANVHSELCRPDGNQGASYDNQCALFLLNDLDIDFDYSRVRNALSSDILQKITILY